MTQIKKYSWMGAMAAMLAVAPFAACSDSEEILPESSAETLTEAQITAGLKDNITRASGSNWEAGDSIGVFVCGVTNTTAGRTSVMASMYHNVKYQVALKDNQASVAELEAASETRIFFQDSQEIVTFAAYYPYSATITEKNRTLSIHTTDQSKQKSFDVLYASGAQASKDKSAVAFTGDYAFSHVLSKLCINLSLGTGFPTGTSLEGATVKLSGLVQEGSMSLEGTTAGQAMVSSSASALKDWDVSKYYGSLILLPQDLSQSPLTLAITLDGQTYKNATLIAPKMQPGYSYTYNITVNLTGLTLSGSTINAWTSGTGGEGSATL
jgi:hypothetical protein